MINRRSFLFKGLFLSSVPIVGQLEAKESNKKSHVPTNVSNIQKSMWYADNIVRPSANMNYYISHRGVHLKQTVAAENSLEALILAKRAGFECIEFDVRRTKDDAYVVIHDETINRTLKRKDGKSIPEGTKVRDLTFKEIREDYVMKSDNVHANSQVLDLEEYLYACTVNKLIPFIEIKEANIPASKFAEICNTAKQIVGAGNFIITSNNKVNEIIRANGDKETQLMGILYQTTFEKIQRLENVIMAISTSQFASQDFVKMVKKAKEKSILTESHADNFARFDLMYKNGVEFFSTDLLAPNPPASSQVLFHMDGYSDMQQFETNGNNSNASLNLGVDQSAKLLLNTKDHFLIGAYLEIKVKGHARIKYGNQNFEIKGDGRTFHKYQLLLHKADFLFQIQAVEPTIIDYLNLKIIKL